MDLTALMSKIQQGDDEAFTTLYAQYNKTVYRIAFGELQDQTQALSVVKDVFREAYKTIKTKGPYAGDFYAWLDALTAKYVAKRKEQAPASAPVRQYSQAEAKQLEEAADARLQTQNEAAEQEEKPAGIGTLISLSLLAAALLWILIGLLGSLEVLPAIDLGYQWFNGNIFELF